jgi:hypothetical protein
VGSSYKKSYPSKAARLGLMFARELHAGGWIPFFFLNISIETENNNKKSLELGIQK